MKKIEVSLKGVYLLIPTVHEDHRGWFMETYSKRDLQAIGLSNVFVQDNQSLTIKPYTLRGLHFQNNPMAQAKIVRVLYGAVQDVVVDIRRGSPTFGCWESVTLSAENKQLLYIPSGFAHGFLTLEPNTLFAYKVDNYYDPACDRGIRFDDPAIGIQWAGASPILSEKDRSAPLLGESDCNFIYGE